MSFIIVLLEENCRGQKHTEQNARGIAAKYPKTQDKLFKFYPSVASASTTDYSCPTDCLLLLRYVYNSSPSTGLRLASTSSPTPSTLSYLILMYQFPNDGLSISSYQSNSYRNKVSTNIATTFSYSSIVVSPVLCCRSHFCISPL